MTTFLGAKVRKGGHFWRIFHPTYLKNKILIKEVESKNQIEYLIDPKKVIKLHPYTFNNLIKD